VFLAISGYPSFAMSSLVSVLIARNDTLNSVSLSELLPISKIEAVEA